MSKILITGVTGQDGAYLSKLLLEQGHEVHGITRRSSERSNWRLIELGILDQIKLLEGELTEQNFVNDIIKNGQYTEMYNLGAQSFVQYSFSNPSYTYDTNFKSVLYQLEAIKSYSKHTKYYQASTSEMFGLVQETPQKETTSFYPRSPYGVAKLGAHWLVKNYRESFGLFACSGILFNHESELRGEEFVTRKITKHVAKYSLGLTDQPLELGNLEALRDWGHSQDYVKGTYKMLQNNIADDYVLATGETHSVKEFVERSFRIVGVIIQWKGENAKTVGVNESGEILVKINPLYYRPCEVDLLLGDPSKAERTLNWSRQVTFDNLIEKMVNADINRLKYVIT